MIVHDLPATPGQAPSCGEGGYEWSPGARLGLTYDSQVSLDFSPALQFSGLAPGRSALFSALGLLHSKINEGIRVPQAVMLSGYYELDPDWAIMADVGWQEWSKCGDVEVSIQDNSVTSRTVTTKLPFHNTMHYALGAQVRLDDAWKLNFGSAYDSGFQNSSSVST